MIVGGGIIGLTTAYVLAREGACVTVVDQGAFGREASWAGAGILAPGDVAQARSPWQRFRACSVALIAELSRELAERTGLDNGYSRCGGLDFTGPATDDEWRGEGAVCQRLQEAAVRQLEPVLAAGVGPADHLPDLAQLRNPRHLQALQAGCQALGVCLRPGCPAFGFERRGNRILWTRTAAGPVHADRFLVASGAWTDGLLEPLGWRPGVQPIRGQIALLNTGTRLFRHVLLQGSRYVVPRADGRVLIGSTEEDVGFDKRTTAGAIAELLAFAAKLVPALASAHLERCWAGLRPGSPDGLPVLGQVPGWDNLFVATGHFRSGIQLSAGTATVLKELLLGQKPSLPVEAFRPDRLPAEGSRTAFPP